MREKLTSPHDFLLPYQREWVEDLSRFKAGCWARQTGKGFSTTEEIVVDAMANHSPWMIAAPSERQAMESLAKAKDWVAAYELAIEDYTEDRPGGPGTLIKSAEILLAKGGRIIAVPGKPETVRGFSMNVFLDEFAFFENPDETWRAIYPSISNPLRGLKKMRIQSTPGGKSGSGRKFWEIMRDNYFEPVAGRKTKWSCHFLNIHDAVKQGLPDTIDELREGMDDAEGWAQEFECEFMDDSSVLLPYELIAMAESSDASETVDPTFFTQGNRRFFCGVDFGRQNDPSVCWTLEQVGDVLLTREVLILRQMDTPDQQAILETRLKAAARTCFDYTGPGIGLGDYLAKTLGRWDPEKHTFGKLELCTFTPSLKRQIFPKLRRTFEAPTRLRIPISVEVREDLHAVSQVVKNGQYSYVAPRTAKGHSDRCTALALAVRAAGDGSSPFRYSPVEYPPVQGSRRAMKGSVGF